MFPHYYYLHKKSRRTSEKVNSKNKFRLCLRDSISEEQALQRIKSQMPIDKKIALCDIAISNDKTEKDLIK